MKTLNRVTLGLALLLAALFLAETPLSAQSNINSPIGKTNYSVLLADVPMPPGSTPEAGRRAYGSDLRNPNPQALDDYYQAFNTRLESVVSRLENYMRDRSDRYYATQDEASMREQAIAMANENPILASMGGAEKVAQMSPEEAKAAALQATASYTADPFAASGVQSPGMTALYQKIISDPAYAERFQKMSEKEREAELRRFMANDKPMPNNTAQKEQQAQEIGKTQTAIAFQQQYAALQMQAQELNMRYSERIIQLSGLPGNHREIDEAHQAKYAAIPEIIMGEGREKDPDQVLKLQKETAKKHQEFAGRVLQGSNTLLLELQAGYRQLAAEYAAFFASNGQNLHSSPADQLRGQDTEALAAQCELAVAGLALSLVDQAKSITKEAAEWEVNLARQ